MRSNSIGVNSPLNFIGATTLDMAYMLIDQGISVIPCHSPTESGCSCKIPNCTHIGKHTTLPHWGVYQKKRMSKEELRNHIELKPEANLMIVTGEISGLIIIDVDGEKGIKSLSDLKLPQDTVIVKTGNGFHIYYKIPADFPSHLLKNSVGKLAPGIDIRANGGLAVVPPSRHESGRNYEFVNSFTDIDLAEIPKTVINFLMSADRKGTRNHNGEKPKSKLTIKPDTPENISVAIRTGEHFLKENFTEDDGCIIEGMRNDALFKCGCSLRSKFYSLDTIRLALIYLNENMCKPPLNEQEIEESMMMTLTNYEAGPSKLFTEKQPELRAQNLEVVTSAHNVEDRSEKKISRALKKPDDFVKLTKRGTEVIDRPKLAEHIKDIYRVLDINNTLMFYNGSNYSPIQKNGLKKLIKSYIRHDIAKSEDWDEVYKHVLVDAHFNHNDFNPVGIERFISFGNGLYDVDSKKLLPHDPDFLSNFIIKADFVPGAKARHFLKYLSDSIPDKLEQQVVQEVIGYLLSNFTCVKKAFLLYGVPNSGKSVLIRTIDALIGDENCAHLQLKQLSNNFSVSSLFCKSLNSCGELDQSALKDASFLKLITGGDAIDGDVKFGDRIKFRNTARLLYSTNDLPQIYDDRTALERFLIVPFNISIAPEDRINDLFESLIRPEFDGIVTWALEGLHRLIDNNFVFTETESARNLLKEHRMMCSPVVEFVENHCIRENEASVQFSDVFKAYEAQCRKDNTHPISSIAFSKFFTKEYRDIPAKEVGKRKAKTYFGLRLK